MFHSDLDASAQPFQPVFNQQEYQYQPVQHFWAPQPIIYYDVSAPSFVPKKETQVVAFKDVEEEVTNVTNVTTVNQGIDFNKSYPFDANFQVWHVKNCSRGKTWKPVHDFNFTDIAKFWECCSDSILDLDLVKEYDEFGFFMERAPDQPSGPDDKFWDSQEYNGKIVTHITEVIFNLRFIDSYRNYTWKQFSDVFLEAVLSFVNYDKEKTSYFHKLVGLRLKKDHDNNREKIFPQIRVLITGNKKDIVDRVDIDDLETDFLSDMNECVEKHFNNSVHIDTEIIQFLPNERRTGQRDQWGQAPRLNAWKKK